LPCIPPRQHRQDLSEAYFAKDTILTALNLTLHLLS
jgi:hypothetical protein